MENLKGEQITPTNPTSQNTPNDFAEKQPLLDAKTIKIIRTAAFVFVGLIILLIAGLIAIRFLPKSSPIAVIDTGAPVDDVVQPDQKVKPYFGYIKDDKAIWIADTNGESKQMVLDISPSSNSVFSTLTWKSPTDLTYVICTSAKGSCDINTINIDSKSISKEYSSPNTIKKVTWDKTSRYLAFIEDEIKSSSSSDDVPNSIFKLKTGTIVSDLFTFPKNEDPGNVNSRVLFSSDNQYIVYYGVTKEIKKQQGGKEIITVTPFIVSYLLNGTRVDQLVYAKDPFFITENKIGYTKNGKIVYKTIGLNDETIATEFNGSNPEISPDKSQIAYWYSEGSLNNVVLGVFDTNLNIHRNILRGIVLPYWISDSKILGIKADNCLQGTSCQLYEFRTNSISLVDITKGNVVQIDQGKRISEPSFVFFEDKDAD